MIHYNPTVSGSLVVTGSLITTGNINGINLSTFSASINSALTESKVTHIVSQSSGVYYIDGVSKPSMSVVPGITYRFDTTIPDDPTHQHPFKFSTSPNGPTQYVDGVTSGSNFIQLEVNYNTPELLYYYCTIHSNMGNTINVLKIDKLLTTLSSSFDSRYVISGSITQTTWDNIASKPNGIVSGSSQVVDILSSINTYTGSNDTKWSTLQTLTASNAASINQINSVTASINAATSSYETMGRGIISSSAQLSGTTIANLTVTNLTTINETASVIFSSGSNRFGDFSDDTHEFTGSVKISGSITTIGSSTATSFSGAIAATNNVISGSSQIAGLGFVTGSLTIYATTQSFNTFTQSYYIVSASVANITQTTDVSQLNSFTASTLTRLGKLEENTASLNLFTASNANTSLNSYTSSQDTKNSTLSALTASMAAQVGRIQESTASLNTYTSSLKTALQLTGSNVVVLGDLTVLGTTNTANSTTLNVSDKFITLASGSTTSAIANGAGFRIAGANVTMSWDSTNSQLKFNTDISASKFYGDGTGLIFNGSGIVSSSVQTIANLPTGTVSGSSQVVGILSSLNTYTGSNDTTNTAQNTRLTTIESVTGSYETKGRGIVSGSSQVVGSSITTNTVTVGSTAIALGSSATTIAGLTSVTSTGFTGALTGNASTATTLQNARTINGTSFNGSSDITIANLVSGSSQITYASISSIPTGIVSGSSQITYTSISSIPAGIVSGSSQVSLTATTGYGTYINQALLTTSSPSFAGLTINSSTAKTYSNSSYSTTFSAVSSVSVTHSLGTKDVMVMCYDSSDEMFWPATIKTTSTSVVDITFTVARTGRVVIIR